MNYQHRFLVKAPISRVAAFHRQPASLSAITPPPVRFRWNRAPERLAAGSLQDFTLWLGPLPIRWLASIEDVTGSGFTDRQLSGPFASWVHRHEFVQIDDRRTEVVDRVSLELKRHLLWGPVGLGFLLGLPLLFAYRGWKTRRLLEKEIR
jgi:ligand-binding SRPBCC domain-containing protein